MKHNDKYIDLHIHTDNSDGFFSAKKIIEIAFQNNTNFLAISDHDSIGGLADFRKNLLFGMMGVNAVEFSSYLTIDNARVSLHVLGYGFDENNIILLKLLKDMRNKRVDSHLRLLNFINNELKKTSSDIIQKINIDRYCWFDQEIIKCMEFEHYPNEIVEHYKNHFKYNIFSYGKDYEINVKDVISTIKSASGIVVLAHPMAYGYNRDKVRNIIYQLSKLGIDGIEVYQSDCSVNDTLFLKEIADRCGLLCSVGSDFHGGINTDGRIVGKGINNNLCVTETTLTNKILQKKKYFERSE